MSDFNANPVSALLAESLIAETFPNQLLLVLALHSLHHMFAQHNSHLSVVLRHISCGFDLITRLSLPSIDEECKDCLEQYLSPIFVAQLICLGTTKRVKSLIRVLLSTRVENRRLVVHTLNQADSCIDRSMLQHGNDKVNHVRFFITSKVLKRVRQLSIHFKLGMLV